MPIRLRVVDFRNSHRLRDLGYCDNSPDIPQVLQTAQTRLLNCAEAGEEGWLGSFAEMAFTVSRTDPYLTTPRGVVRLEMVDLCSNPVPVNNQFYEYLEFGNGRMPKRRGQGFCHVPRLTNAYTRNPVPLFQDLGPTPQFIQIFPTDPQDSFGTKRVLLQGLDLNGIVVRSMDGVTPNQVQVQGEYNIITAPFSASPTLWSEITGVQKDVTQGPVQFFKVDPTTGETSLILSMEPSETVASYRRYFFHPLPKDCCSGTSNPPQTVQVTAIAALEAMPLIADTDYLLLQGDGALEAIVEECQSVRYSTMDTPTAKQMSRERHKMAVSLLNGTLTRYLGKDKPAVNVALFGSARLERAHVGMM